MQVYGPTHLHGAQPINAPHTAQISQVFHTRDRRGRGKRGASSGYPMPAALMGRCRICPTSGRTESRGSGPIAGGRTRRTKRWKSRWAGCWTKSAKRPSHAWKPLPEFSLGSVRVKLSPLERFAEFLQTRGKRVTRQRRLIVEQVFSHHDHFDADELMTTCSDADRPAASEPADGLPHAGRIGRGRHAAEDDPRRPQRLRARIRLPQPRPPLLPGLQPADRVPQRRTGALRDAVARQHDFQVSATGCSSPASARPASGEAEGRPPRGGTIPSCPARWQRALRICDNWRLKTRPHGPGATGAPGVILSGGPRAPIEHPLLELPMTNRYYLLGRHRHRRFGRPIVRIRRRRDFRHDRRPQVGVPAGRYRPGLHRGRPRLIGTIVGSVVVGAPRRPVRAAGRGDRHCRALRCLVDRHGRWRGTGTPSWCFASSAGSGSAGPPSSRRRSETPEDAGPRQHVPNEPTKHGNGDQHGPPPNRSAGRPTTTEPTMVPISAVRPRSTSLQGEIAPGART